MRPVLVASGGTLMASRVFSDEELARRRTFPKAPCGAWWASVLDEGDALWSASPDPLQELLAALGHA
jgi:hypothetical protein